MERTVKRELGSRLLNFFRGFFNLLARFDFYLAADEALILSPQSLILHRRVVLNRKQRKGCQDFSGIAAISAFWYIGKAIFSRNNSGESVENI